jgi:hypothetical protein
MYNALLNGIPPLLNGIKNIPSLSKKPVKPIEYN